MGDFYSGNRQPLIFVPKITFATEATHEVFQKYTKSKRSSNYNFLANLIYFLKI